MKIGVFDSGLGGLAIARAMMDRLPQYDYIYLGDTKRVPYGGRSQETIHEFTAQALSFLFEHDCQLIILACNTASAESLRKSQQEYLPNNYPDRRVLGVIIPTAEAVFEAQNASRIGVLATQSTVESKAYERELLRQQPSVQVIQTPAPLLVPLIENGGEKYLEPILDDYLEGLIASRVDALILGCTHYCLLKDRIRAKLSIPVVSQDEVIPEKLENYLKRHPEIESRLDRNVAREFYVTDITATNKRWAEELMGSALDLRKIVLQ